MSKIQWYNIDDLYTVEGFKIKHNKNPKTRWIKLPCVYKIKINNKVVHVGRSDTCRKHGGAEKVRKALVNLLGVLEYNKSVCLLYTSPSPRDIRRSRMPSSA